MNHDSIREPETAEEAAALDARIAAMKITLREAHLAQRARPTTTTHPQYERHGSPAFVRRVYRGIKMHYEA